jgi:hypothetical protein
MIAQHLEHPLDSVISNTIITLHSRAHPGCQPLQGFFRLRKRAKNLHPEPEKESTGFEIVTLETVRATTQVWIRARFQLLREENSSVATERKSTKRSSPDEDDDADEEDGIKRRTEEESDPIFLLRLFTALVSPHSYQLGTYQPTIVFSFTQFCQVGGLAIIH